MLSLVLLLAASALPAPSIAAPVAQDAENGPRIDAPTSGARVSGTIEVRGRAVTADPARFSFYRLYYGAGSSPSSFRPIGSSSDKPVEDGLLGTWDTAPLFQGEYTLQLSVYDTSGGTSTTSVVVTVLPVATPTPRNLPSFIVPTPETTPNPDDDTAPPATPLPELPELVPNIPQIDVPPQNQAAPAIQQVQPPVNDPGFQPVQIDPGPPRQPQVVPFDPGPSNPSGPPSFDSGQPAAPQFNPVNPVGPPPVPVIVPNEPAQPTLVLPATPTIFGLPP
jgi:hypothetical protein